MKKIFLRILSDLDLLNIPYMEKGFRSIPKVPCFAVWENFESTADGADDYSLFWIHSIELVLYFSDGPKGSGRAVLETVESSLRQLGNFKRKKGYNADINVDYISYIFDIHTDFEEDF